MSTNIYDVGLKLCVVGSSEVGKSALLSRLCDDSFPIEYTATVGAAFRKHSVSINNQTVELDIWDMSGGNRLRALASAYYRGVRGFLLVFDVTNHASFEALSKWVSEIREINTQAPILVVGTKADLDNEAVSSAEIQDFVLQHKIFDYIKTSAKTDGNVENVFIQLATAVMLTQVNKAPEIISVQSTELLKIQVKDFVEEVKESLSSRSRDGDKGHAIDGLISTSMHSSKSAIEFFKEALRIFLQQDRINFSDMTNSGKRALAVLNSTSDTAKELREAFNLGPSPLTYRKLRVIAADNGSTYVAPSFFDSKDKKKVYNPYLLSQLSGPVLLPDVDTSDDENNGSSKNSRKIT